ncbi:MAG TPA: hypothetical protein VFE58_06015 [Tepidisphaeraceae bacterium]|jgi:hypothetical protein|nr:hypothetical protein [Tepidisphaeraceae bacterium]
MSRKQVLVALFAGAIYLGISGYASAQDNTGNAPPPAGNNDNGGNRTDRGNRGNRGNFDPSQFRQQMMDRMKEQLGSSDDEWKVLEPRIDKVMTLQRDARGGSMFRGRSSDRGGSDRQQSADQSAVQKAQADLKSALDDKSISADEIAKRLATYRQAKEQSKADLAKAQSDLKELLSQRQEAQLVMYGMLD